jgi:hypothetical protein
MLESESMGGLGDAVGFVNGEFLRHAAWHGAKTTGTGADIAQDHEGGGSPGVTFRTIGTAGIFANGFQVQLAQQIVGEEILVAGGQWPFEPGRQSAQAGWWRLNQAERLHGESVPWLVVTLARWATRKKTHRENIDGQKDGLPLAISLLF